MKNIMLIYPPGNLYQRGEDRCQGNIEDSAATAMRACNDLGYAAAVLLEKNYNVMLRDYQTEKADKKDFLLDVERFCPDMIVLSTTNATVFEDIEFINNSRKYGEFLVALKGAIFYDAEQSLLDLLDLSQVDFLIGGEIDFVIGPLADYALRGIGTLENIDNIFYKVQGEGFKRGRFHVWETDLDSLPFPARHLMKNELYVRPDTGEPMATIQTSRGCPAQCIYCLSPGISGKEVRYRSPENVIKELTECFEKYGIKNFFFKADTFTIDYCWVEKLCDLIISSQLYGKIHFTANSRVNPLKKETLELMKRAGCFAVAFGFESGSEDTLKRIKKGATLAQNRQAAEWARKINLPVYGFYMIGFPWETEEHIRETRKLIFELNTDFIEIHIALPYYGTVLYQNCKESGTLNKNVLGSDYFNSSTSGTKYISMQRLIELRKNILLKYYLRPSYILRRVKDCIRNPKVFKNYYKYGVRLINHLLS